MTLKSFMERDAKKGHPSYRRAKKQEKELALRGGGRAVPGSGNGLEKGDVAKFGGIYRVEAKTTKNKSFSVTRAMVAKLEDSALPHGELPAIIVEFNDGQGRAEMEVAVVPVWVLER